MILAFCIGSAARGRIPSCGYKEFYVLLGLMRQNTKKTLSRFLVVGIWASAHYSELLNHVSKIGTSFHDGNITWGFGIFSSCKNFPIFLTRDLATLNNIDITQSASAGCRIFTKCWNQGISPSYGPWVMVWPYMVKYCMSQEIFNNFYFRNRCFRKF